MALVTRADAAAALGVAPARINRWVEDGAPVAERGTRGHPAKYDIDALRQWVTARADQKKNDGGLSLERERALLTREQIEKTQRENRLRAGELVERLDVIREGQAYTKAWAAKVKGIPRRLVQLGIIDRAHEAGVAAVCREVLTEIAGWKVIQDVEGAA